jgi:hypothetical protein
MSIVQCNLWIFYAWSLLNQLAEVGAMGWQGQDFSFSHNWIIRILWALYSVFCEYFNAWSLFKHLAEVGAVPWQGRDFSFSRGWIITILWALYSVICEYFMHGHSLISLPRSVLWDGRAEIFHFLMVGSLQCYEYCTVCFVNILMDCPSLSSLPRLVPCDGRADISHFLMVVLLQYYEYFTVCFVNI